LEKAIKETVESPEFKEQGAKLGYTPAFMPAKEFTAAIAKDDTQIAALMDKLGMKKTK
jgi:tripartite-type tricarboxylate transporter receptor subunit TctC